MRKVQFKVRNIGYWLMALVMFAACSADRKNILSKTYHNTTARYNAYFIAQERLQEVEDAIAKSQDRDFNKLLRIFPVIDTNVVASVKPQLEDAIKKASIAIERHKNSKWVDDSYILVGKARYYAQDFVPAIETFKYVNTKSEDNDARHQALINLMLTFIDANEMNNAKAVADYLRKEKLNKENKRKFDLVRAYFYRQREDWATMAQFLEEAAPATKKNEGRAKLYYILGQLYQQLGDDKKAFKSFRKVLKSNPDYELSFYARLNMAQVFNLAEQKNDKQIRRYFSKLLKDKKNKEYRDKIYYEFARFEERQGKEKAAVENYKKSIQASVNNPRQKGYAYLRLGELYYNKKNYELAKAYYDSTVTSLPQDEEGFAAIQSRQEILEDLVTNLVLIQEKDSLLRLVQLDSTAIVAYLDQVIEKEQIEERRRQRLLEPAKNQVNIQTGFNTVQDKFGLTGGDAAGGSSVWYFYNPSLVSIGKSEFVKKWESRPLADNWRLTNRGRENTDVVTQDQATANFKDDAQPESPAERIASRRNQLYETLPFAPEEQVEALKQVETAYFNVGKIYNNELTEPVNAINSFDTLLLRFPNSEYKPEVLYYLYLIYSKTNPGKAEEYKQQLIREFPNSSFAKVAINPNYSDENNQVNEQLKRIYAGAYKLYSVGNYSSADSILSVNLKRFPDNSFSDNLRLLQILIIGKTESVDRYQLALNQFLKEYEGSDLAEYATELLKKTYEMAENKAKRYGTQFVEDFDQKHYFILVYENEKKLADELIKAIDSFNLQFKDAQLKASNIALANNQVMVFVSQFDNRSKAMQYYRALERSGLLNEKYKNANLSNFVITKDNFQILYDTKDVSSYIKFFNKFYK